jgi:hypothetical protein
MNRNRLTALLTLIAALALSGCGGVGEKAGADSAAATATPGVNAASPTPTTGVAAGAVATPAEAAPTLPASAGEAAARPGASPAPGSRGAGSAPQAKPPAPQIGSGGNDLFLFTQARAAINDDADLKAANVVVDVKEGVVTLSGAVASAALKTKAEELARGAGAKDVRNQLRVSAAR